MSDYVRSFAVSDDYDYNETHKRLTCTTWEGGDE